LAYIGQQPPKVALTTSDIGADIINADKIANDSISEEHIDNTAITGFSALTSLADTDKFLVSDASDSGNLKYVENQYLGGGGAFTFIDGYANDSEHTNFAIDNCFTSTYQNYLIQYSITVISGANNTRLQLQMRTGGASGSDHGSAYRRTFFARDSQNNTDHSSDDSSSSSFMMIGANAMSNSASMYVNNGQIYVHAPVKSGFQTNLFGMGNATDWNGYQQTHTYGCRINSTTAMTGVKFYANQDNLKYSHVRVYGIADS